MDRNEPKTELPLRYYSAEYDKLFLKILKHEVIQITKDIGITLAAYSEGLGIPKRTFDHLFKGDQNVGRGVFLKIVHDLSARKGVPRAQILLDCEYEVEEYLQKKEAEERTAKQAQPSSKDKN